MASTFLSSRLLTNVGGLSRIHCKGNRFYSTGDISINSRIALNDGNKIPVIALGTWKSKPNEVKEAVKYAIQVGYRHIDCSPVYKNEREVGEGIAEGLKSVPGLKREDLFITSKLWNTEHHPERIRTACEQTLHDLGLKYLDLYLIHWPVAFKPGNGTHPQKPDGTADTEDIPLWETWEAMENLVEEEHVRSLGVSNFTTKHLEDLMHDADLVPAVNQVELHPYLSQPELVQYCKKYKIQVEAYSPLGTGSVDRNNKNLPVLFDDKLINKIAQHHKKSPAQVILRWGIQKGVVPLPKSITPERIKQNIEIFDFHLSNEEVTSIDQLNSSSRYVNPSWGPFANTV